MASWRRAGKGAEMFAILVLAAIASAGCDAAGPIEFEPEVVVEGYLRAGGRLPSIRVSRTIELDATYTPHGTAITDAMVSIHLLNESGEREESVEYRSSDASPGSYVPVFSSGEPTFALPLRTYELQVDVPDGPEPIRATTLVPDTFSVVRTGADSVVYQASKQFSFLVSSTTYPGRQNVFVFTTLALDGRPGQLTPFAESLIEGELSVDDLRERASPILNEDNFEHVQNDFLRIRFPWLAIYFYGRNQISVSALDDNLYDFIRSQMVQQGGSTLPPGEIPNILERVEGGRGVFGSYARASTFFYVLRP